MESASIAPNGTLCSFGDSDKSYQKYPGIDAVRVPDCLSPTKNLRCLALCADFKLTSTKQPHSSQRRSACPIEREL